MTKLAPRIALVTLATAALLPLALPGSSAALSNHENSCRDLVATTARRSARLLVKARGNCVRGKASGKFAPAVDCLLDPAPSGPGTGNARVDKKLGRAIDYRGKLDQRCKSDVTAAAIGVGGLCAAVATLRGSDNRTTEAEWQALDACAADLGKTIGDNLAATINKPAAGTLGAEEAACRGELALRLRKSLGRGLGLTGKCFSALGKDPAAGLNCYAVTGWPGTTASTGDTKLDSKMTRPSLTLFRDINDFCSGDVSAMGFGLVLVDPTGGTFTSSDLFHSINDQLAQALASAASAVFPGGPECGDSVVDPDEQCDDGNRLSCDGCDRNCTLPACSNGAACAPETCDDGNTVASDGCSAACITESCGDGVVQAGLDETCDDGNTVDCDGCDSTCRPSGCGSGAICAPETCDDGNTVASDGCSDTCITEFCGDSIIQVDLLEQCDNGAGNSDVNADACRSDCRDPWCGDGVTDPASGETCDAANANSDLLPNSCRTNCLVASCGDGVTDSGETCDDGNSANLDSCLNSCLPATCGDGFLCSDVSCTHGPGSGPEHCDDGDANNDNACSNTCSINSVSTTSTTSSTTTTTTSSTTTTTTTSSTTTTTL